MQNNWFLLSSFICQTSTYKLHAKFLLANHLLAIIQGPQSNLMLILPMAQQGVLLKILQSVKTS